MPNGKWTIASPSVAIPSPKPWLSHIVVDLRCHLGLTKVNDYGSDSYSNRSFILTVGNRY